MKKIIITGVLIMNTINSHSKIIPDYKNLDFKPEIVKPVFIGPNKIKAYIKKDSSLPTIRITAFIKTGHVYDPSDKVGLGSLFFNMIKDGGTKKFKSDEIDKKLEYLGAEINTSINNEDASISMFCHKNNFDDVFEIFADIVQNPAFEEEKFNLKKQEAIEIIKRRNDEPSKQASREALRLFFGRNHPYGRRPEIENIEKITVDDLKKYHSNFFSSKNIVLSVAGDFDEKEITKKLESYFSELLGKEITLPELEEPVITSGKKIYVIDKPIRQAFVVILNKGIKRHDDREFPLSVLTEYIGGGIQSKLGNEIRSKRGLAYSVYQYFSKRDKSGFIMTSLGTKPESVGEAIYNIFNELKKAKEKLDEKELNIAKSQIINSYVFRFETVASLLNEIASYDIYSYPEDYIEKYTQRIDSVKDKDAIKMAKEFYDLDNYLIFIVGDYKKFESGIKEFGEVNLLKED